MKNIRLRDQLIYKLLYFENFAHSWVESSDVLLQLGKDDVVVGFASVANKKHFEKKELVILSTVQAELVEQVGVYTLYKGAHKYYAKKIADLLTSKETCKDTYLGLASKLVKREQKFEYSSFGNPLQPIHTRYINQKTAKG